MDFQEFSSDIIFEILTRVSSLKTLDTCKLVCKEWHELIYDSRFMPTYYKRTNNVYGYLIQDMKDTKFVSFNQSDKVSMKNIMPPDISILASCNQGILCCATITGYYVCKPTTKQWQILPKSMFPWTRDEIVAITILQSTSYLRYKIVKLAQNHYRYYERIYKCEIFESKYWTWFRREDLVLANEDKITKNRTVAAGDYIYWLTGRGNVLAFRRTNDSFHKFKLPEPVYKNREFYVCKHLSEYQRKLGFTCRTGEGNMELWILEDTRIGKWIKKMTINLENIKKITMLPSLVGFYNADIALIKGKLNKVVLYNVQDCSYNTVMKAGELEYATECFRFRSDFESINLLVPSISRATKLILFIRELRWVFLHLLVLVLGFFLFNSLMDHILMKKLL